jgi:hypothetical protein
MVLRVAELSANLVAETLVQYWRDCFPGAGHIVELSLNASSPQGGAALRAEWVRILGQRDCFIGPENKQFPDLTSFAVRFAPGLGTEESAEMSARLADAWRASSSLDGIAEVVGQAFCAYESPHLIPLGQRVEHLRALLDCWRGMGHAGNLSFPSVGIGDDLIQFEDPGTGGPALSEANVWQSDLSSAVATLAFTVDANLDAAEEIQQFAAAIGEPPDLGDGHRWAQWCQEVSRRGVELGKGVLRVAGKLDEVGSCGISVAAWKNFALEPGTPSLVCHSIARDKHCLLPFSVASSGTGGMAVSGPAWPLPDRPCFERLFAVGLAFMWK